MIDSSLGESEPSIKFINHKRFTIAHLNKSHGFVSWSFIHRGKSNGLIL
jgi:hypothetical protein